MLAAGETMAKVCQTLEVEASEASFHRWRNQYGGMKAEGAKRLKAAGGREPASKEALDGGGVAQGHFARSVGGKPTS
jgi:hypothetical protein